MKNLIIIDHPLVKRDLTLLRNKKTPSHQFRAILRRTASLMAYEVSRDLQIKIIEVDTPLEKTKGVAVDQQIVLVPDSPGRTWIGWRICRSDAECTRWTYRIVQRRRNTETC